MNTIEKSIVLISGYFKKDELIKSGSIVFIASLIAGFFSYIYQVYMGRMLGPEEYGTFGALFAIFYMIGIISSTLSTSTTRFVSKFIGEGKQIGFFIKGSLKRTILIGFIISIIFLIFSVQVMNILKLTNIWPVLVLILILFLTWITPIFDGSLRGIKKFSILGINSVANAFCKLIFGILLVGIGFGVSGALFGVVIGMIVGLIISYIFVREYIRPNNPNEPDFRFRSFYFYSVPVMLAMISHSIPSNLDVILAKHFFSSVDAGIYNSVAVMGKIIFFFPGAIGTVMFPNVAEKYVKGEDTKDILKKSIWYTAILSGSLAVIYILFPGFIMKIFGDRYMGAVGLVGTYGMAMFFFSIIGIMVSYHLAVKDMRYIVLFTGFTIIEVGILAIFGGTILDMVEILMISNLVFLAMSMAYTFGDILTAK